MAFSTLKKKEGTLLCDDDFNSDDDDMMMKIMTHKGEKCKSLDPQTGYV